MATRCLTRSLRILTLTLPDRTGRIWAWSELAVPSTRFNAPCALNANTRSLRTSAAISSPVPSVLLGGSGLRETTCRRYIHRSHGLGAAVSDAEFEAAKQRLNTLKEDPGNDTKLKIYSLFKQSTVGECNTRKPGALDFVGKAKWAAWNSLRNLSQDEARQQYVDLVDGLLAAEGGSAGGQEVAPGTYTEIEVSRPTDGVFRITLNRPAKKNAITWKMYEEIVEALDEADRDDSVVVAVLTGAGDYYSSGNDLSNFTNVSPENMKEMAANGGELLRRFVGGFIDFSKPLIAAINGPAVGIPVTSLGLCDVVYASDQATFHTPFSALGQSPEGCSSYLFPKIMGQAKANEMLLFGRKLAASEAFDCGLVNQVFPHAQFQQEVDRRVAEYAQLPRKCMRKSKGLIRGAEKATLEKVNQAECELLVQLWTSDECVAAVMNFFTNKQ